MYAGYTWIEVEHLISLMLMDLQFSKVVTMMAKDQRTAMDLLFQIILPMLKQGTWEITCSLFLCMIICIKEDMPETFQALQCAVVSSKCRWSLVQTALKWM